MSVPREFHSTLCRTHHTLCISVCQPITEVKAEWNVAADVREIGNTYGRTFCLSYMCIHKSHCYTYFILLVYFLASNPLVLVPCDGIYST